MMRCSLGYLASDRIRWQMTARIPARQLMRAVLPYHAAALLPARMGWGQNLVPWELDLRSDEAGTGSCPWEITIRSTTDPRITSSEGALLPGSYLESLPNGETKAALVLRASVPAGKTVSVSTVDELTLFSGSVVRSAYDAESDTWTVTAADPLSAQGMDEEFEIVRAGDVAEVIPFEFLDLSQGTAFPTVPVSEGITLRYWVQLLEALRGARLYYDPVAESYVLSDNPRAWNLSKVLTFSEEVDASQYFNLVVAEQNDSWEENAARATTTKDYQSYRLTVDRAGDKIFSAKLTREGATLVDEVFEYDADNQLTRQVSRKDSKTTTTEYVIQPGEVPFVKREMSVTVDPSTETEFDERRIRSVDVALSDERSLVVRLIETREWWEGEGAGTTPAAPEPDPLDPPTPEPLTLYMPVMSVSVASSGRATISFYLQGGTSADVFSGLTYTAPAGIDVSTGTGQTRYRSYLVTRGGATPGTYQIPFVVTSGSTTWNRTVSVVVTI